MVKQCKFNYKIKCTAPIDCQKCAVFKKTGQQTFAPPQPKPTKIIKKKSHTVKYYKVKK